MTCEFVWDRGRRQRNDEIAMVEKEASVSASRGAKALAAHKYPLDSRAPTFMTSTAFSSAAATRGVGPPKAPPADGLAPALRSAA